MYSTRYYVRLAIFSNFFFWVFTTNFESYIVILQEFAFSVRFEDHSRAYSWPMCLILHCFEMVCFSIGTNFYHCVKTNPQTVCRRNTSVCPSCWILSTLSTIMQFKGAWLFPWFLKCFCQHSSYTSYNRGQATKITEHLETTPHRMLTHQNMPP